MLFLYFSVSSSERWNGGSVLIKNVTKSSRFYLINGALFNFPNEGFLLNGKTLFKTIGYFSINFNVLPKMLESSKSHFI